MDNKNQAPYLSFDIPGLPKNNPNYSPVSPSQDYLNTPQAYPNGNPNPDDWSWFGNGNGDPGVAIPGLQAFGGLASAYTGYKSLNLAEDQFDLSKRQYNRDLANQTQVFNSQLESAQAQALRQTGAYDTSTPAGRAAFEESLKAYVENNRVDGSAL